MVVLREFKLLQCMYQTAGLPIGMMEQDIMEGINENIMVIILWGIGCGKTTQNVLLFFYTQTVLLFSYHSL